MPWKALPYSDRDRKGALSKKFKVSGIPTLVILDPSGAVSLKAIDLLVFLFYTRYKFRSVPFTHPLFCHPELAVASMEVNPT